MLNQEAAVLNQASIEVKATCEALKAAKAVRLLVTIVIVELAYTALAPSHIICVVCVCSHRSTTRRAH